MVNLSYLMCLGKKNEQEKYVRPGLAIEGKEKELSVNYLSIPDGSMLEEYRKSLNFLKSANI